jgi:hypothetical protein
VGEQERHGTRLGGADVQEVDRLAVDLGALWRFRVTVTVRAPAAEIAARLPLGAGVIEPVDAGTCTLSTGADTPHQLALYLGLLDADFTVTSPPELVAWLRTLATRYLNAIGGVPQRGTRVLER